MVSVIQPYADEMPSASCPCRIGPQPFTADPRKAQARRAAYIYHLKHGFRRRNSPKRSIHSGSSSARESMSQTIEPTEDHDAFEGISLADVGRALEAIQQQ
eukprot:m.134859 g.134859  ORF g.134859 m.134859 type:complete len:101 (+) comp15829_c0_seq1:241-543(+)